MYIVQWLQKWRFKYVDINLKIVSLKCSWIRRLYNECHDDRKIIPLNYINNDREINFNYTYNMHSVLVTELTSTKIWFIQKYKQQESWSNKNHRHKFLIYWICSTPGIRSIKAANIQILVICFLFYIIPN